VNDGNPAKIARFVARQGSSKSLDSLSTEALTLFNFLVLVVDIRYRHRYGKSIEWQDGKGYSDGVSEKEVLADQIPSVDTGLLGFSRRRISDENRG
jgi:hypothetical protein